jgi:single-stranded-DNA-specific exonuclease
VAQALAGRGVSAAGYASFINPVTPDLSDPFKFPDMTKAVERLWRAVQYREPVLIHGDYDTDGVTATALLARALAQNGAVIKSFLPHRFDDGYGFTPESLHKAMEETKCAGCKVLVTVDCGINSTEAVDEARRLGIDVIITDHHEPGATLPAALAIINPKLHHDLESLHLLSGAGVAFKLSQAFVEHGKRMNLGGFATDLEELLDFVALGTVADIVPLTGENRILVKHGLKILKKQIRPGIRALIEISKVKGELKPSDITFKLAPRVNAAGRLGNPNTALALLTADKIVEAHKCAKALEEYNVRRQEKEQEIYNEARKQIEESIDTENAYSILVAGRDWHQGVIGIVASRLARDFNRPAIVLTIQNNEAYGSGRSVGSLNLVNVLSKVPHMLLRYGGHPMAVGLSLESSKVREFSDCFESLIRGELRKEDLVDNINYDGDAHISDIDDDFFSHLELLAPFGHMNTYPVFRFNHLECVRKSGVADNRHCRGVLRDKNDRQIDFIAYNKPPDTIPQGEIDALASPVRNEFYGEGKSQLQIVDIRQSY